MNFVRSYPPPTTASSPGYSTHTTGQRFSLSMVLFKDITILFIVYLPCSVFCRLIISEYEALRKFYVAFNGEFWTWPSPENSSTSQNLSIIRKWNFTDGSDPCIYNDTIDYEYSWYGLSCSTTAQTNQKTQKIIRISLFKTNLTGLFNNIPETLYSLKSLRGLTLSECNIFGSIFPSISKLESLQLLCLRGNYLTGGLDNLLSLPSLTVINVADNSFGGIIPQNFGDKFLNLTYLSLRNNSFIGRIDNVIKNLTRLGHLDIATNSFSGTLPTQIGTDSLTPIFLIYYTPSFIPTPK